MDVDLVHLRCRDIRPDCPQEITPGEGLPLNASRGGALYARTSGDAKTEHRGEDQ